MLGGGSFTNQNKALPGAYINFVSASRASAALSDRGVTAVPLTLSWGVEREIFEVSSVEFQKDCQRIFGYSYTAPELRNLREIFRHATKGVFYRLNSGEKAANIYATAKYSGKRGNDIKIVIASNVDDTEKYDVSTLLDLKEVDKQTVASAAELEDNDFVLFKKDAALSVTAGVNLTGGSDGDAVTGDEHAKFLAAAESYSFHTLCCPVTDVATQALYVAYVKRMRDEAGVKFQMIVYRKHDADYEGVISVENQTKEEPQSLVYWVAGAEAACAVNKTVENQKYDGEYTVDTAYTQVQLEDGIRGGKFMFHKVGSDVRVLTDINTFVGFTEEKGEDFSNNQTVRVLDQIGNDIASLFNTKYLGHIPNDDAGRISLWNDIVTYNRELERIQAIENVKPETITVEKGKTKRAVVVTSPVTPMNCMGQLYMTVVVE